MDDDRIRIIHKALDAESTSSISRSGGGAGRGALSRRAAVPYSILNRGIEREVLPSRERYGMGAIEAAYNPPAIVQPRLRRWPATEQAATC